MEDRQFETACFAPGTDWSAAEVTLYLTASDARRIVRALEEKSVRLGGSPGGAQMASGYVRLASIVRRQSAGGR